MNWLVQVPNGLSSGDSAGEGLSFVGDSSSNAILAVGKQINNHRGLRKSIVISHCYTSGCVKKCREMRQICLTFCTSVPRM
jgi:hypothetical protein